MILWDSNANWLIHKSGAVAGKLLDKITGIHKVWYKLDVAVFAREQIYIV